MKRPLLAAALALCLVPLAAPRAAGTEDMSLFTPSATFTARVRPDGVTSPQLQLTLGMDHARGRAYGAPLSAQLGPQRVNGQLGGNRLDLYLSRPDQPLEFRGLVGTVQSSVKVTLEQVRGRVGACDYDLAGQGGEYTGYRSCGGAVERTRLRLPEGLWDLERAEQALVLALFLAA